MAGFSFKGDDIAGCPKVMYAVCKAFGIEEALNGNGTALEEWDNQTQIEIPIATFAFPSR